MSRHDLTDEEWSAIRVFLPAERPRRRGRPWKPHRQVVNGMLWVISLGGAWPDVPEEFGKWKTIYNRFRRWQREGLWDRIMKGLLHRLDREGKIDRRLWCVDGTLIRAHRAAGGADTTAEEISKNQALGRSQGGFGTKLHLLTDGEGTPLAVTRTPGQSHESKEFENILSSVPATWQQQPNRRPIAIAGDKGYSATRIRDWLQTRRIKDVIATRSNERRRRFNKRLYRQRNVVERTIGWLKERRRIATRYDKQAECYLAIVKIAIIRKLLKLHLWERA